MMELLTKDTRLIQKTLNFWPFMKKIMKERKALLNWTNNLILWDKEVVSNQQTVWSNLNLKTNWHLTLSKLIKRRRDLNHHKESLLLKIQLNSSSIKVFKTELKRWIRQQDGWLIQHSLLTLENLHFMLMEIKTLTLLWEVLFMVITCFLIMLIQRVAINYQNLNKYIYLLLRKAQDKENWYLSCLERFLMKIDLLILN
jgi:hypothetical protein